MKNKLTLLHAGNFEWLFNHWFIIDVPSVGLFAWSNPKYPGGDNTIRPIDSRGKFLKETGTPFTRDKGYYTILDYCGEDVIFVEECSCDF